MRVVEGNQCLFASVNKSRLVGSVMVEEGDAHSPHCNTPTLPNSVSTTLMSSTLPSLKTYLSKPLGRSFLRWWTVMLVGEMRAYDM
jgi:hypothetical protein